MIDIESLIQKCNNTEVLVIGDFVLDKWIEVNKFEHEVDTDPFGLEYVWQKQVDSIGAAGIIARQCKELCSHVTCVGAIGTDIIGRELEDSFKKQSIQLANIVDLLPIREDLASPFRERIFRGQNIQVLKLMRSGYTGQALLELLEYADSLSEALQELPKAPDIVFICDYSQGFFTQNMVYQLGHNLALKSKVLILKTRQWKDIYKVLPISVLFLDSDPGWSVEDASSSAVERVVCNIAKKYSRPISMVCNLGERRYGLFEFNSSPESQENVLVRGEYINKRLNKVGLFSAITALVGILIYRDHCRNRSFIDDALSLITFIEQMPISWEYEIANIEEIKKYHIGPGRPATDAHPAETVSSTINILFLAADPTDTCRLRLDEEFREIQEKIKLAQLRDCFRLELPQLSVRPADISQAFLDAQPQIVHFSGHGTSTGALCFENEIGQTHFVQPDALAALFEQFAHQVNCVLLNACYSENQAKAIAEYIEYVIGMNQEIGDKAAIAFAIGFYQALGAGRTIEEAYKLGCAQIKLQGIPEHLTPVLIKKAQMHP